MKERRLSGLLGGGLRTICCTVTLNIAVITVHAGDRLGTFVFGVTLFMTVTAPHRHVGPGGMEADIGSIVMELVGECWSRKKGVVRVMFV